LNDSVKATLDRYSDVTFERFRNPEYAKAARR
jgi:hypothetical protein